MKQALYTKLAQARTILARCIGTHGVWADPSRYRYQCWTRDLVIAIMPQLIAMEKAEIVRTHLENLSKMQRPNGQIPILFLDRLMPFLYDKVKRSLRDRKISFMLRRFLQGELWNLTPGTRDSEILYLIGMFEYANHTNDWTLFDQYVSQTLKPLDYIEGSLMHNGLVIGCDWRDTMHIELGERALLTNNALLYHAYRLIGKNQAWWLRQRINEQFWDGTAYLDYPGSTRFDPLGGAFAVLYDVAPKERWPSLVESFRSVDTPCGVTIKCRHNPISDEEKEVVERTDGVVTWPFVVGFTILALVKMGEREFATEQFNKLLELDGFREWYDPATGRGYGAQEQLWSATLFLRAATALGLDGQ